ncbi:hypothetical protein EDB84DRAFT_1681606 [Lactarius hengduanensis]|nr:hypothetical protein EDB84DRAFT_1681606 [Lactarius hengduanensis]
MAPLRYGTDTAPSRYELCCLPRRMPHLANVISQQWQWDDDNGSGDKAMTPTTTTLAFVLQIMHLHLWHTYCLSTISGSDAARPSPFVDLPLNEPGLPTDTADSFDLSDGCASIVRVLCGDNTVDTVALTETSCGDNADKALRGDNDDGHGMASWAPRGTDWRLNNKTYDYSSVVTGLGVAVCVRISLPAYILYHLSVEQMQLLVTPASRPFPILVSIAGTDNLEVLQIPMRAATVRPLGKLSICAVSTSHDFHAGKCQSPGPFEKFVDARQLSDSPLAIHYAASLSPPNTLPNESHNDLSVMSLGEIG